MKTEQDNLKQLIDRRLSTLTFTRGQQVLRQADEKAPRRARLLLRPALAAGLALLLVAGVALAFSLSYSKRYNISRQAAQAMHSQYGFDESTLGMFFEHSEKQGETWIVRYQPIMTYPQQAGSYEVIIKDGLATASWSLDNIDPALYQDGSLGAPVWGARQLKTYMEQKHAWYQSDEGLDFDNWHDWSLEQRAAVAARRQAALPEGERQFGLMDILPEAEDLVPEEALRLARKAVLDKYGVTSMMLGDNKLSLSFVRDLSTQKKHYLVQLLPPPGRQSTFVIKISSPDAQVLECSWFADAKSRSLPLGKLDKYRDAVQEYVQTGAFAALNAQAKAQLANRIAAAGLADLLPQTGYVVPGPGLIAEEEAIKLLHQALFSAYQLEETGRTLFSADLALLRTGSQVAWQLELRPVELAEQVFAWPVGDPPLGHYRAQVDARSGQVLLASWSLEGKNQGAVFTKNNFGPAPAYAGYILPWFAELKQQVEAIWNKYEAGDRYNMNVADNAAGDALFRAAGFPARQFPHGLPGQHALSLEAARKLADIALREEMKVDQQLIASSFVYPEYFIDTSFSKNPGQGDVWSFTYHHREGIHLVTMDAIDGSLLIVQFDPLAAGNG